MSENKRKLIIGLGNPGPEYAGTRHNLGFMMLDALAEKYSATWHDKPKFRAMVAEIGIDGHKVILAKPTTFYNLSGEAAAAIVHFYKLEPADVLAIHDELDLPLGTIRTRLGGSDAGNNGIKSLIQHLGPNFARIRIGIADEYRAASNAADFVLGKLMLNSEAASLQTQQTADLVQQFIRDPKHFPVTSLLS